MKTFSTLRWIAALIIAFLFCACQSKEEKKHITIAYINWQESIAMSYVAQKILQDQGYEVKMVYIEDGDVPKTFSMLADKKVDIFMNFWLPVSNKLYLEKHGNRLTKINTNYVNARIGLVVPEYMPIYSIEDLTEYDSLVNHTIIGFEEGTGIMKRAAVALKAYDLKTFHLYHTHEKAILDSLHQAIQQKKPIVITGWTPHWMFARYNVKFLDDPHLSFGEGQRIDTYAWKGFARKRPYTTSFFSRILFTDKTMANLLDTFDKIEDPEEAAKAWIEAHPILVANWLPHE